MKPDWGGVEALGPASTRPGADDEVGAIADFDGSLFVGGAFGVAGHAAGPRIAE